VTRPPSDDFGFKQTFSVGNDQYFRSLTSVDTGALGDLRLRISYRRGKDGWVENTGNGPDFNADDKQGRCWSPAGSRPGRSPSITCSTGRTSAARRTTSSSSRRRSSA
jgi:hypothetical protein